METPASLDTLRVLAACVRHGTFSRAAVELCVTPSAVSARIRGLEAELGVTLFERRGPKLVATERAVQLATTVEGALESIRSAVDGCRSSAQPLRVTCAPTFARWLVPQLASYHRKADAAPIALDASAAVVSSERFDVAVRYGRGPWPGVASALLFTDRGTPMLSPKLLRGGRAPSPRRLLDLPLLRDARWARWFEAAGVLGASPSFAPARFATYELEAAAAAQGIGVALLSPLLYGDRVKSGELLAPYTATVEGPDSYWVLWHEGAPGERFAEWLQGQIRSQLGAAPVLPG